MIPQMDTDCENVFRTSNLWREASNFQKIVKMRHSFIVFLLECVKKQLQTKMMVLEIELQHAESFHSLLLSQIPEFMPSFQNDLKLDQLFKFLLYNFLAFMELKFRFHPRQRQIEIPGWSYVEEGTASWMSYISKVQDTIRRVMKYFWKDLLQKKVNFVLQSWSNPASRKLVRRIPKFRRVQRTVRQKFVLLEKRKWKAIPACESFKEDSLSAEISNLVVRLVRKYDQDEFPQFYLVYSCHSRTHVEI